ncbi:hypothetical protein [Nitrospina watsonii]|uniref:hypothetical protein n=1 Tax=Nitrospina watsonii TaxID=1323948 RepID=UPI00249129D1|nr:hypothetical protein [Nitrospina watsonii]
MIALSGLFMASIGWLKWPDLMIDYGSQVYLPWQISEGKVLYRDIHYLFGPLSSHVHGLLFSVFGPSIRLLMLFNLFLVAVLTGVIFVLFRRCANALTATLCGIGFLAVFALAQYPHERGNFNFVSPYNYELTQGVFLAIVTLFLYQSYLQQPRTGKLAGTGCLTGLVFLTKPEVFLPVFLAMISGLSIAFYYQEGGFRKKLLSLFVWVLAVVSIPFMFWIYLALYMPGGQAFQGLIGPWLHVWDPLPRSLPMYQWAAGLDDLGGNLTKLLGYALDWVGILALIYATHQWLLTKRFSGSWTGWLFVVGLATAIGFAPIPWTELARPLPLLVLALGIVHLRNLKKAHPTQRAQPLFLFAFSLFSFVLMFKILFNVHVYHYGFALAFPAFMLLIRFLVFDLPAWIPSDRQKFSFGHAITPALVLTYAIVHMTSSYNGYLLKNYPVSTGPDTTLDYNPQLTPRGVVVNAALGYIDQEIDPKAAFPVLPGGSMLNYLSRHTNPFPFLTFDPLEMHIHGEARYLERFQQQPPQYIIIVSRDYLHLGAQRFGKNYANNLHAWIRTHYKEAALFGEHPSSGKGYGILFLKHSPQTQ